VRGVHINVSSIGMGAGCGRLIPACDTIRRGFDAEFNRGAWKREE
jgi:hypothetical protein